MSVLGLVILLNRTTYVCPCVYIFFLKLPDVCSTSYYLVLKYVLKLKNTFWDVAVEMSVVCYLMVGYALASCFEF